MSPLVQFALEAGGAVSVAAVIAATVYRAADAPLWAKITLPTAMLALGIAAPWQIYPLMGLPRAAVCRDLPKAFELMSFVPNGEDRVYLWLRAGGEPRAYDVPASADMKSALMDARTSMARQGSVRISVSCESSKDSGGEKTKNGGDGEGAGAHKGERVFKIETNETPK